MPDTTILAEKIDLAEQQISKILMDTATLAKFSGFRLEVEVETTTKKDKRPQVTKVTAKIHAEI